ncbi:hypothetical protein L9F63_011840, partial [Diploptera punctata]
PTHLNKQEMNARNERYPIVPGRALLFFDSRDKLKLSSVLEVEGVLSCPMLMAGTPNGKVKHNDKRYHITEHLIILLVYRIFPLLQFATSRSSGITSLFHVINNFYTIIESDGVR